MKESSNQSTHVTEGCVFEDLGFSAEEAAGLRMKAAIFLEIKKVVEARRLTPREVERLLQIPQPRASDLLNGKIMKTSSDLLARYLHRLGREVQIKTKQVEAAAAPPA